ncbi:SUKH-3 domain-containing protein [Acinetobacter seifertii]|uniref:SUKH-3 domain-containing protein n=1 Tax=Acinetobacter seifertii TaxID=1530123 RepID=UPI001F01878F|nr:SUKH-3 domain-containing protein [Acinetobacter seifertii]MCG8283349.1 SUKH-3 domain-containing protein [Acinetobacter seifertii]
MKYPNHINSDFFKKMITAGWYAGREVVLDKLPSHLEEFSDEVKNFLNEIWFLNIVHDVFYSDQYQDIKYYNVIYSFGETTLKLIDYSQDDEYLNLYKSQVNKKIRNFGYKDGREILMDEDGRIYEIPDSGDLYYLGGRFYEGLFNLIYGRGESYLALGGGEFINLKNKEKYNINNI